MALYMKDKRKRATIATTSSKLDEFKRIQIDLGKKHMQHIIIDTTRTVRFSGREIHGRFDDFLPRNVTI